MPTKGKARRDETDIPSTIMRSDKHAQAIWKKTHDSAVETYGEGEAAHRVAFASLKHSYKKEGDHWEQKDHKGPSDPQAARGPTTRHKSTEDPPLPTAGGKEAHGVKETKAKAKEAKREDAQARRAREKKDKD